MLMRPQSANCGDKMEKAGKQDKSSLTIGEFFYEKQKESTDVLQICILS